MRLEAERALIEERQPPWSHPLPLAHLLDLLEVMPAMQPMKLSPLPHRDRTQNWMVRRARAVPKFGFAFLDHVPHGCKRSIDFIYDLFVRDSFRPGAFWGVSSARKVAEIENQQVDCALFEGGRSTQRPFRRQTAFQIFCRALVSQG